MAEVVYSLCALTSLSCAILLIRQHRRAPTTLLLWSAIGFSGFTANNILLVIDLLLLPDSIDLWTFRTVVMVLSYAVLLFGLIWENPEY